MLLKDVVLEDRMAKTLLIEKHRTFLSSYPEKCEELELVMSEHFKMSGMYWLFTARDVAKNLEETERKEVIDFVQSCYDPVTGGYRPALGHDPHVLYTLSALQVLALYDELGIVDVEGVVRFIQSLQMEDGSFQGDCWGEIDTRFTFCAAASLALLNRLNDIDREKAVDYVMACENWDGGFGVRVGSESHSGQIFCCLGALSILGELHRVKADLLGWWLCERQLPSGGLNGRPEKLPDVCYSWWVMSSLKMLGRLHWIDHAKMRRYILACQDDETGGIADRPGDVADPFHTLFGLAGLSLMAHCEEVMAEDDEAEVALHRAELVEVDPVFCMPRKVIERMGIQTETLFVGC